VPANYHAEHVGSLLRPPWLLEARSEHKQGRLAAERLRELEDRAVLEAIELQHRAGVEVFTDGELRRDTWMAGLLESTGGVVPAELPRVTWHRDGGTVPDADLHWGADAGAHGTRKSLFLILAKRAEEPGRYSM
jgi:methionine synthase II (cobalamin-independent)